MSTHVVEWGMILQVVAFSSCYLLKNAVNASKGLNKFFMLIGLMSKEPKNNILPIHENFREARGGCVQSTQSPTEWSTDTVEIQKSTNIRTCRGLNYARRRPHQFIHTTSAQNQRETGRNDDAPIIQQLRRTRPKSLECPLPESNKIIIRRCQRWHWNDVDNNM